MPVFEDVNVSTTTVVVSTNLSFHLQWFYDLCTVLPATFTCRTSKEHHKRILSLKPPIGTITLVQYKDQLKGFKVKRQRSKYFRNALSLVVYVGKLVTIKIPTKGKIQITGCIDETHTTRCITVLWGLIAPYKQGPDTYMLVNEVPNGLAGDASHFVSIIDVVMTNKVFKLGFHVNRQNLDQYMNMDTDFNSLLETSFGYTGVNIKIPFAVSPTDRIFKRVVYDLDTQEWVEGCLSYQEYTELQPTRHRTKRYRNTFLVFHSGTAIMSGMTLYYMKDAFDQFITLMTKARPFVEEHIVEREPPFDDDADYVVTDVLPDLSDDEMIGSEPLYEVLTDQFFAAHHPGGSS
jgi:hypothetical protein